MMRVLKWVLIAGTLGFPVIVFFIVIKSIT